MGEARENLSGDLALRERVKELACLYGIAHIATKQDALLEDILKDIVRLLPVAWLYPEIAQARIVFDGRPYVSTDFIDGKQGISSDIVIDGKKRGLVEVVYTQVKPLLDEGPFLKEERNLIDTVAREVSVIIEKQQVDKEKVRLQEQMRHSDRLATVGQLAAGVAHELNEPLSNILGFAQLAKKSQGLPKLLEHDVDKIISASLHAREVVKKLLLFSRQTPTNKNKVNLNQIVQDGLYFLKSRCEKEGIEMVRILTPNLPEIYADSAQLHQVLVNIVVNAIQAMPTGGKLTIKTLGYPDNISLVVEDTGIGMTAEVLKKIFVPFFTTKEVGQGTGLGLSLVHGIVTSHGGTIDVESSVGRGARFEVKLPITAQAETPGDE